MTQFDDLLVADSQDTPHYWAATFGGHAWVALGPWGIIAIGWNTWAAAIVTPILYLLFWEGMQWIIAKNKTRWLAWDCILDTVAVAFGCFAAAYLADDAQLTAVMCWAASVGVMATGWVKRA